MKKCNMCVACKIVSLLVIVGAINWGLFGVFGIDLVARLLGGMTTAATVVYGLIGVAGVIKLISCFVKCPGCKTDGSDGASCSK